MLTNLKPLVVIVTLAIIVFAVARPICLRFMQAETFTRRRNIWFALTLVAFVLPSFWMYALFALALLLWATGRDENPLALYVLVAFTVPNVRFYIPGIIVNQWFDITQYRILSFAIVLPVIVRLWSQPSIPGSNRLKLVDVLLLAFLILQVVLPMQYESATNTMRRAFLFMLDTFVVFYAFSRLSSKEKIVDVMACFWMACAIMAPIAIFEWAKGWLLYTGLSSAWGDPNVFAWLFRGSSLRAQAAAGHSLNLGYVLSIALGFFLYLRGRSRNTILNWLVIAVLSAGIFVSGARGPWLTAATIALLYTLTRPDAARKLAGAAVVGVAFIALLYMTPLKESILDRLPFIGTSDQASITYRQQLAEASWLLIKQNPFFGDPFVYLKMEELRQGQGIIDIVNGYLYTALFTGLVGLGLVIAVFVTTLARSLLAFIRIRDLDPDAGAMGASLVACLIGTFVYIGAAGYEPSTYALCGILISYAKVMTINVTSVDRLASVPQRQWRRSIT